MAGFKCQVTVTVNFQSTPIEFNMTGEVCAPVVGCKSFSITIPVGSLTDA